MHQSCLKLLELNNITVLNKKVIIGDQKSNAADDFSSLFSDTNERERQRDQVKPDQILPSEPEYLIVPKKQKSPERQKGGFLSMFSCLSCTKSKDESTSSTKTILEKKADDS